VIRRLAAVLCSAVVLSLPAAPGHAEPDPTTLPVGDPPAVTWQSGTTVHLPNGKTVALPLGKAGSHYEVLGRRGGEWLVLIPGYDAKVLGVKGSKVRTVWKHVRDEAATHYTLADGGKLVVEWNYDRSGTTEAIVFDLKGKVVASRSWPVSVDLLDFWGDTMLISAGKKTQTWQVPGGKPVSVAPGGYFGDLAADLLFVNLSGDFSGPTSLSSPGTPAWSSDTFIPGRLSPDGQYVAGWTYTNKLKLEVRKVADGAIQPVPGFKLPFESAMTWEPDGSLLLELRTAGGRMLVRCTVAGTCSRATDGIKGQHLGFPA